MSVATSCPISYVKMQERYAFSPRIWREEHLTSLARNYNPPQQNTLLQIFAALAFNLTKLPFISCIKVLFSWNYFICMLHIYDTLIGCFTLSRLGFFCLVGSDRGQYFQNYYMYANEIITGWSYCKTEYTLYFCC